MEATTSGWAQFNGCFGEGYCTFGPDGQDRQQIEQIVQPYAQAIAGLPDEHHYDPATRTLRITYADGDATGATEIAVPATKLYPKGWRLDVDGTKVEPSTEQPAPGVDLISVEVPNNGTTHTLCLTPTEAPQSCATAPVDAGSPRPSVPPHPTTPIVGEQCFTIGEQRSIQREPTDIRCDCQAPFAPVHRLSRHGRKHGRWVIDFHPRGATA
ncbi:MAG: hypothetical protein IPG03_14020 [Candidatus Microthrix sp.]|nr:hypothetical protein [Candidatus Microthrix sp.]MBK6503418.1 hypothetical protein [Candidatus Microthrix sp.]